MGIMVCSLVWARQDSYHQPFLLTSHGRGEVRFRGLGFRVEVVGPKT